jgi:hypothetical protein
MKPADRKKLVEQLRSMAAGRGDGIDIDTPFHWVVEGLKQPSPFFKHLPELLPTDSILYVEGAGIAADVAKYYTTNRAHTAVEVVRDSIFPVPDIYHFRFSPDISRRLQQFAESRSVPEMFDHLKAYKGESLLFTFHDAFDGWLRISEHLPDEKIERFCKALGVSRRCEQTKHRDKEQLGRLLWAFEHPDQVKIRVQGEPWWKRLWRQLTR